MSDETVQLISKNLYITVLHKQKPGNQSIGLSEQK